MRLIGRCVGMCVRLSAVLLSAATLSAQTTAPMPEWQKAAGGKLAFDVASVRPSQADAYKWTNIDLDTSEYFRYTSGPVRTSGSLTNYIIFAYKILDTSQYEKLRAQLPKWAQDQSFAVEGRAPMEKPTKDQMRLMMQSLLADRFGLQLHTQMQEQPVYEMTLTAPDKPGLQPHPVDDKLCAEPNVEHPKAKGDSYPANCQMIFIDLPGNIMHMRVMDRPMAEIAGEMARIVSMVGQMDARPIVDKTGLTGHYDLSFDFARPPKTGAAAAPPSDAPELGLPFLDALKRQAGLDLVKATAPVPTYVIDAVQQPTPN